ncbi:hypothetical protein [Halapricum desulfuricans]|uniref:Uncharacterized protein n=1 Tax=Halapricum desulfuricans TaxID=2841257 RepID=A0A897NML9_9EURY|nr:hypothetical protein [Halapricum desulfuricans]QSG14007.1 Uncharacterized protein HSEST_0458 [Halapricum desulfuricans]
MKRREMLKATGAAATASAMGLAGCNSVPFLGGDDGSTGSFSAVSSWLPEPGEISDGLNHYSFSARTPSGIYSAVDDTLWKSSQRVSTEFGSLPSEDVEYRISMNARVSSEDSFGSSDFEATIYTGSFDADWIGDKIEYGAGYATTSEMTDSRTLFRQENAGESNLDAFVVDENENVVINIGGNDQTDTLPTAEGVAELLFDANAGEVPTYTETSDMSELASGLSMGHTISASTQNETELSGDQGPENGRLGGTVAQGTTYTVNGTDVDITRVIVFDEERDVDENDIKTYIAESGEFTRAEERPSYSISGRRVSIEWTTGGVVSSVLY